jgi:alcohol dehydrogenase (cytochrome c)
VRGLILSGVLLWSLALSQTMDELINPKPGDWPSYGRTLDMWRFSPLDQVNNANVDDLRMAWSRSLGFVIDAQFSPSVYDGIMYINGADRVMALDGATGDLLWEWKTTLAETINSLTRDRSRGGVVVYDGKVFHAVADGRVVALDRLTGEEIWSTQVGAIEYGEGFSSSPIFADGKLILGPAGADAGGVNGRIVAADVETGEILWTFNTVPQPGEPGFETWSPPSAAQYGGGSAWVPGMYDPQTNTIIYGVGQPIPWWAGSQRQGDNLYTSSYVALDGSTGELKWYHQVVPRDEWDLDQIATATVLDLEIDGANRRVAVLPTVTGFIVLLDIETGEFLRATQYMPEVTIHIGYTEDGTPIIDDSMRWTDDQAGESRTVCGFRWVDFEPSAYSPVTGLYYRPNSYDCIDLAQGPRPDDWQPGESAINIMGFAPLTDRFDRVGGVSAIDLTTGEIKWEFTTGYSQRSGVIATAGNLVFAGFPDRGFRAFDAVTGDVLWEQRLTAYISANPVTYSVDGKQYVAVPVGGQGGLVLWRNSNVPPIVTSDVSIFVFALP